MVNVKQIDKLFIFETYLLSNMYFLNIDLKMFSKNISFLTIFTYRPGGGFTNDHLIDFIAKILGLVKTELQ